ncbi:DUF1573 domain-containing protein [Eisenibacter elegans]|uniref:DUF1573 domain-containing protein n=1 Tax=Eisenibacter elegans TaxID=997 RepID=UPI0004109CAC|nr:DUF1573 domain-containing protein [Eisenibacter elegans]
MFALQPTTLKALIVGYLIALPALLQAQGIMVFEREIHDFGVVAAGTIVTYEFGFVNKGNAPIQLLAVEPSCGCTSTDWTREPVPVGKTGFVRLSFNTNGYEGAFAKSVLLKSNAREPIKILFIKGLLTERAYNTATAEGIAVEGAIQEAPFNNTKPKLDFSRMLFSRNMVGLTPYER